MVSRRMSTVPEFSKKFDSFIISLPSQANSVDYIISLNKSSAYLVEPP